MDKMVLNMASIQEVEVISTQFLIRDAVSEDMVSHHKNCVANRHCCLLLCPAACDPMVKGTEVSRIHEAARAPQPKSFPSPQKTVYRVNDLQSIANRGLDINQEI